MEGLRLKLNDKVLLSSNLFLPHSLYNSNPPANYESPCYVLGSESPKSNKIVILKEL